MRVDVFRQLMAQGATIRRLSSDSRRCAPGVAFLAYPGEKADGRSHIGEALRRGASAVLWEERGFAWRDEWRVPNVAVRDLAICIRDVDQLPPYARQFVEHLRKAHKAAA